MMVMGDAIQAPPNKSSAAAAAMPAGAPSVPMPMPTSSPAKTFAIPRSDSLEIDRLKKGSE